MHCTIFVKVDYIKFFIFRAISHNLAVPTCHQHSRLMFNNYYQTLHLAKLIPSSYDMVIFAKLVLFDISKKLSIVSPNPNAEHVSSMAFQTIAAIGHDREIVSQ